MSQQVCYQFPATGLARVSDILGNRKADPPKPAFIPVSKTEWYRGIGQGRFPPGVKLSRKTRVWSWEELHALKARIEAGQDQMAPAVKHPAKPNPPALLQFNGDAEAL